MKRRAWIAVVPVVALLASVVIAARSSPASIPTVVVHKQDVVRHVTAEGTVEAEQATAITAPNDAQQPMKIGWIADDQIFVHQGDVLVRFDPTDFETALLNGSIAQQKASNRATRNDVDRTAGAHNLERDALQAEHELEVAQAIHLEDADIYSRYQRVESDIDKTFAQQKRDYSRSVRTIKDNVAGADAALIGIDKRKADFSVAQAQRALNALVVTAPHDGVLVLKRDWRGDLPAAGSTVWPGTPIADMPKTGAMKAVVFVLEADAGGVTKDDRATVTIESAPGTPIPAVVSSMSKVAKPRFRDVPVQYFEVQLKLQPGRGITLKPGARARATVTLAAQNDVIAVPRQTVFANAGEQVVFVRRNGRFVPQRVTLGTSTAGRIIVNNGLKDGDEIALRDPR
ncbi:MAG TPA: HlyD family efflux transporter periplasmic adaptor subunit [Thermoanaerobaculia bacterium]|nr:HlyD family efflux transporter periplasmic adaptor subunit [Thermoanaerobaculia bacterium]